MDRADVVEMSRRRAEPAVTIIMSVHQPVVAHPENVLRLRALVDRALDIVDSWWGTETSARVRAQLDGKDVGVDTRETAHGLAVLATPEDCRILRLPFAVHDQVVVDRSFATRQLLEGLARQPRFRVLVLSGHHAALFEGRGDRLEEVTDHSFPLDVDVPHEWDTPQRDLPIHEESEREEHRIVYRRVDDALVALNASDPLPLIVTAAERELALFDEVTTQSDLITGRVHGSFAREDPGGLAEIVRPAIEAYSAESRHKAVERVRESHEHGRAVTGLPGVQEAAKEGRGHELVVEEGFAIPRHLVDGLSPGEEPDEQLDIDDIVDDIIETVLLQGGEVEFVEPGELDDCGHIGLVLRYS